MEKIYRIFLASSNELEFERQQFEIFIGRENKRLNSKNVSLRLEVWEDMDDALNTTCKQEDYNEFLQKCQICVVLFWTKVGKYTNQEFDLAYRLFKETGWPKVYVYEKTVVPIKPPLDWEIESKNQFLQKIKPAGNEQFQSQFEHYAELENRFKKSLDDLFLNNILTYGEPAKLLSPNGAANPNVFIGREDELKTIRERLEKSGSLLLINAEGGIGKTTLAARYWNDSLYRYGYNAWLFCENGIINALKELAPKLNVDLTKLDEAQQILVLKRALTEVHDDFLLVLDNANNAEDIQEFKREFPGLHWHVLITSRCNGVFDNEEELPITHLPPDKAKELFTKYYKEENPDFETTLDRLLLAINYHTLLIEIFAKNLREVSELGMTLAEFLQTLQTKGLYLGNDSYDIPTFWTDNLKRKEANTDEILDALYDFSDLTEAQRYLLVNISLLPAESYKLSFLIELFDPEDKRTFRDTIKSLYQKGWIGGADQAYKLSPVVQQLLIVKNKETLWEDGKNLVERFSELLRPEPDKDNITTKFRWLTYSRLLPKYFENNGEVLFAVFLNHLAMVLQYLGGEKNLIQAKELLQKLLTSDITSFWEAAPTISTTQSNLALVLRDQGGEQNLLQAKELLHKSLAFEITNFGEAASTVSRIQSNLALVLRDLGGDQNLIQAKELLQKSLASDVANFEEAAPWVSIKQSNLALVLQDLGGEQNLLQAKHLLQKSLSSSIMNLGETAPSVSVNQSNLALVLQGLGGEQNLIQAKELLRKSLASGIANFGEGAPSVSQRQSNLATVLKDLGGEQNLIQAKELLEKSLATSISNLGETTPLVSIIQSNLATVLNDLGGKQNWLLAKELLQKSLASDIANFGKGSPAVIITLWNLYSTCFGLGDMYEAIKHLTNTYQLSEQYLPETNPLKQNIKEEYYWLVKSK